jgi:hypothetical protein
LFFGIVMKVGNGKTTGFIGEDKIYIGRANKSYKLPASPLANPFAIGKQGDRKTVIQKYRVWLWQSVKYYLDTREITPVVQELMNIANRVKNGEDITLICWCSPQECHGDIIIRCVNWMITENLV